jgi:hypothetical protein
LASGNRSSCCVAPLPITIEPASASCIAVPSLVYAYVESFSHGFGALVEPPIGTWGAYYLRCCES